MSREKNNIQNREIECDSITEKANSFPATATIS